MDIPVVESIMTLQKSYDLADLIVFTAKREGSGETFCTVAMNEWDWMIMGRPQEIVARIKPKES